MVAPYFSEHLMVELVRAGMSRADAYKVAQRNAAKAWDGVGYKTSVASDPDVLERLSPKMVEKVFSLEHHLRHAK
jgi:adenylosuccinate lyase